MKKEKTGAMGNNVRIFVVLWAVFWLIAAIAVINPYSKKAHQAIDRAERAAQEAQSAYSKGLEEGKRDCKKIEEENSRLKMDITEAEGRKEVALKSLETANMEIGTLRLENFHMKTVLSNFDYDALNGVGITVEGKNRITIVHPGTPAEEGGLQVGDLIQSVNGTAVGESGSSQAIPLIADAKDPLVRIEVKRGKGKTFLFEIEKRFIILSPQP